MFSKRLMSMSRNLSDFMGSGQDRLITRRRLTRIAKKKIEKKSRKNNICSSKKKD